MNDSIDPEILLNAYMTGWFPMGETDSDQISWYSPDPRAIIELSSVTISRSLRRTVREQIFETRIDSDFPATIRSCASREETWITPAIIRSYELLHRMGYAHSIESWHDGKLVGGLYGVAIRGAFFGESMFHSMTDASKSALVALIEHLRSRNYVLLDVQYLTNHLQTFGAYEIPRDQYLEQLSGAMECPCVFSDGKS